MHFLDSCFGNLGQKQTYSGIKLTSNREYKGWRLRIHNIKTPYFLDETKAKIDAQLSHASFSTYSVNANCYNQCTYLLEENVNTEPSGEGYMALIEHHPKVDCLSEWRREEPRRAETWLSDSSFDLEIGEPALIEVAQVRNDRLMYRSKPSRTSSDTRASVQQGKNGHHLVFIRSVRRFTLAQPGHLSISYTSAEARTQNRHQ